MKQQDYFGSAQWLCAGSAEKSAYAFPLLRSRFTCTGARKATLRVIGLGFFQCRLNGQNVTEELFLPLSTDFEARDNYPRNEIITGHRIYVPEFDVTDLLREGENLLTIHFGGGWYTFSEGYFGEPKAIYQLTVETDEGVQTFVSSERDKIGGSFVTDYYFTRHETHDYTDFNDAAYTLDFDDSAWENAALAKPLDTEYLTTDCPADTVDKVIIPTVSHRNENEITYDCGQNLSGFPVLRLRGACGEKVEVTFSEEKLADGTIDPTYIHSQRFTVTCDGGERIVHPQFTWFAFRYFSVKGAADVEEVRFIHTNAPVTAEFHCDNETLNWLYKTYLNTQLCNMHAGIPSDCPHLERRGYTGDGQLACHAVMDVLDAKAFYAKWIEDIADCQDVKSGHIQYTAPYMLSGGGPGGWGCAIIEVPYQFYRHYGDAAPMTKLYGQMLRYFDFLEEHSQNNLVTTDMPGLWCLGDWCPPIQVILPAPFVNNYFYIKSLYRMIEIAGLTGHEADIPTFESRISERKQATMDAYFNKWDGHFLGGMQAANAFAVDIGIGDERTYGQLVQYYRELGRYDTGIFGTDLVTKVLFEHGDGDLAVDLLTSTDPISFEGMRLAGATTIWENWPHATWDRSHNHPMFGAVAAYLFDYLLGIRQEDGKAGYGDIVIAPVLVDKLGEVSGKRTLPGGEVSVAYKKQDGKVTFTIAVPAGVKAVFRYGNEKRTLEAGCTSLVLGIAE